MKIMETRFNEKGFAEWLMDSGAEILSPTNQYELLRFRAMDQIRIIYRNTKGQVNFQHGSDLIYNDFLNGKTVNLCKANKRRKGNSEIPTLLKRDGDKCFFCLAELGEDITIEHLVPVSRGGGNHISNKVLAHEACNKKAGNKNVMQKIQIREKVLREVKEVRNVGR